MGNETRQLKHDNTTSAQLCVSFCSFSFCSKSDCQNWQCKLMPHLFLGVHGCSIMVEVFKNREARTYISVIMKFVDNEKGLCEVCNVERKQN